MNTEIQVGLNVSKYQQNQAEFNSVCTKNGLQWEDRVMVEAAPLVAST
jgi:hypothetical protein